MWFFDGWTPIVRVVVLGPLVLVNLIVVVRLSGKRTLAKFNAYDFVVTIALGSLLATAILSSDVSLATSVTAFAILIGSQFVITWVSTRSRSFERWIKAEPTLLCRDGEMLSRAMRRTRVTEREVRTAVRRRGLPHLDAVAAVILEADGSLSVMAVHDDLRLPYVATPDTDTAEN